MSDLNRPQAPPPGLPIVLKVGSSSLTHPDGSVNQPAIERVAEQVDYLWKAGHPAVLVSSGAVAAGTAALPKGPTDTTDLQVAAAVGQTRLMSYYSRVLPSSGRQVGQVLLTVDVLQTRAQYLHARGTLNRMLEHSIVPVVNENDTVAIHGWKMGDNDRLSAIVAHLVSAGLLVLLTDTDGLYTADPRSGEGAPIPLVRHRDSILDKVASGAPGPVGSGGVGTKVKAARMAAWSGIPTVIAPSGSLEVIEAIIRGEPTGTYVVPGRTKLSAWKLWLAFGEQPSGTLRIDQGAVRALVSGGSSLLPVGITHLEGEFAAGALVEVRSPAGELVGKGLVGSGSEEIKGRIGKRSTDTGQTAEVIHRARMVVLLVD